MFKYPVYRHPTDNRFNYILFYSHIIISWGAKNDKVKYAGTTRIYRAQWARPGDQRQRGEARRIRRWVIPVV